MVSATRTVTPLLPAQTGTADGLAFTLWLPPSPQPPAHAGVVVLHGADSCKESHHDFARAAVALGLAAICFDQKGHGESEGRLGGDALDDVAAIAGRLRAAIGDPHAPLALRGSSMGGYLAILACPVIGAGATVAICPASADGLRRGLQTGRFSFRADRLTLAAFVDAHDPRDVVGSLTAPLLLMHAEGDEQVPIAHSRELAGLTGAPGSRLIAVPGGHHRSVQHDEELQAVSLRFITRTLATSAPGA
ncbi:MAG TPA: alpha/beta fold hydrolase [Solirubrobacteraceae bacterium]|jgi:alpha-beta hydrolase superfamily lysophospholipase|nr:alpha/beta fold hydrolase [Solirubrobacteraceae bacterium]